jgi:hypothetical protein
MGDEIKEIAMYTGEQSAAVRPTTWPPSRPTLMAGVVAEFVLGFDLNPARAAQDMRDVADLPVVEADPSPRAILIEHQAVLTSLGEWLRTARQDGSVIPGSDVHVFLRDQGCGFGSRRPPSD